MLYGATGSGKSSVVNAILEVELLPTRTAWACTPCPMEISFHRDREKTYLAEIVFFPRSVLEESLQDLIDYVEERPDRQFEGIGQVKDDVESVCPDILKWLEELPRPTAGEMVDRLPARIKDVLGQKVTFFAKSGDHAVFRAHLELYFWAITPDKNVAASLPAGPGVPLVSLIDKVNIRANVHSLSTGMVLQDLPGTGDTNARRHNSAREYLDKADVVWIVVPIGRAVDDAVLLGLCSVSYLNELFIDRHGSELYQKATAALKNQMLNGIISSTSSPTLIVTKFDIFDPEKVIGEFRLHEHQALLEEWQSRSAALESVTDALDESTDPLTNKRRHSDKHGRNQRRRLQNGTAIPLAEPSREDMALESINLTREVEALRRRLLTVCARDYTRVVASMLQHAYREDLAGIDDTVNFIKPDVFCVASTEYLLALNGRPGFSFSSGTTLISLVGSRKFIFESEDDTGVPALLEHCQVLTEYDRTRVTDRFFDALETLSKQLCTLSRSVGQTSDAAANTRTALRAYVQAQDVNVVLAGAWQDHANDFVTDISQHIQQPLFTKLDAGSVKAEDRAINTATAFADTRRAGHLSGLYWSTFRAVLRHDGEFRQHDLNMLLIEPLMDYVAASWGKTFGSSLTVYTPPIQGRVVKALEDYVNQLQEDLASLDDDRHDLSGCLALLDHISNKALHDIQGVFASAEEGLQTRQRAASRSILEYIRKQMGPVYALARTERGPGSMRKIKGRFHDHIEAHYSRMFQGAVDNCQKLLKNAATAVADMMLKELKVVSEQVGRDLSAIAANPSVRIAADCEACIQIGEDIIEQIGHWRLAIQSAGEQEGGEEEEETMDGDQQ
ncbi:hypothetical protein PENSPDRAFT_748244 [Peniophora sp. CONT]|nr:hypothetical protein PENSPDRAFT_748244 [Peniophora sp. CONT]